MRPVVLDVDTGVDDAMALLLAARHPRLDLRAVTCVAGNDLVDDVVRNTLTVLHAAGRGDVPVARGADRPLVGSGGPAVLAGRLAAVHCARSAAGSGTIGDAGAVCTVLDPGGLVVTEAVQVRVELTGIRGLTTVVPAGPSVSAPTVRVVTRVDGPRYAALWLHTVG